MKETKYFCDVCHKPLREYEVTKMSLEPINGEVCSVDCARKWLEAAFYQTRMTHNKP